MEFVRAHQDVASSRRAEGGLPLLLAVTGQVRADRGDADSECSHADTAYRWARHNQLPHTLAQSVTQRPVDARVGGPRRCNTLDYVRDCVGSLTRLCAPTRRSLEHTCIVGSGKLL